jgi:enamine deaminase RidA (YjgF/YER057c/UK114 family)
MQNWQLPISQSHRVSGAAGPLAFVGGAADFGPDGVIVHAGDFDAQVLGALRNVATALDAVGCTLDDVVRLKAFYKSDGSRDEWSVLAALRRPFDVDLAPAITAHPVPLQPFENQEIQIQAIASRGWRENPDVRAVEVRVPDHAAELFDRPRLTSGLRAGEFIAVPAQMAIDEQGRAIAAGLGIEQTDIVMRRIGETLEQLGASFQDAIKKEGYYFGTTMDEWAPMAARRASSFREPAPVATVVPCHALYPQGCVTKVEVLAMRAEWNGFDKYIPREDRWPERVWDWPIPVPYRQGIALRDMVWTGGQVPFEEAMNQGNAVHGGDLLAQTRFTMGYVNDIIEAFGCTTGDYALLVCYFESTGTQAETEAFVTALAETVDGDLPPMTLVPQPHMHSDDMSVEIWGVAAQAGTAGSSGKAAYRTGYSGTTQLPI